jgi:mannose-1-phosphate guanylyltransferase
VHHLLQRLAGEGVSEVAICANGDTDAFMDSFSGWSGGRGGVRFYEDRLPRGAAGCVADVAAVWGKDRYLVVQSNVLVNQRLDTVIGRHQQSRADLSVVLRRSSHSDVLEPAGMYVFEPAVFDYISAGSYQDIKEQVIPALAQAGRRVVPIALEGSYLSWDNIRSYLDAIGEALMAPERFGLSFGSLQELTPSIHVAADARIDPAARLFGPLAILGGVEVGAEAVLVGPAVVGTGSRIGRGAVISRSVLWGGARIGAAALVSESVLGVGASVPEGASVDAAAIPSRPGNGPAQEKARGPACAPRSGVAQTWADSVRAAWRSGPGRPN